MYIKKHVNTYVYTHTHAQTNVYDCICVYTFNHVDINPKSGTQNYISQNPVPVGVSFIEGSSSNIDLPILCWTSHRALE